MPINNKFCQHKLSSSNILKFIGEFVFPFLHNRFCQFKVLLQICDNGNNYNVVIWSNYIKIRTWMEVIQCLKGRWFKGKRFWGRCMKPRIEQCLVPKFWWKLWWGHDAQNWPQKHEQDNFYTNISKTNNKRTKVLSLLNELILHCRITQNENNKNSKVVSHSAFEHDETYKSWHTLSFEHKCLNNLEHELEQCLICLYICRFTKSQLNNLQNHKKKKS